MRTRGWGLVVGAAVVGATLAGCATQWVRQRMSREFDCPEDQVRVTDLGAGGFKAEGCGRVATYLCAAGVCAKEGSAAASTLVQNAHQQQLLDEQHRAADSARRASEAAQSPAYSPPPPPPPPMYSR